ncbi:MAG: hypothetical protein U0R64_04845 [Candidatus Nanopelagicales bacterium]
MSSSPHRSRRGIAATHLAALLLAVTPVLMGCGSPGTTDNLSPNPTATQLPPAWPRAVPNYPRGTLVMAYDNGDGTYSAEWKVPVKSAGKVLADYGALLAKNGFRRYEWFSRNGETGFTYAGHHLTVDVGTMSVNGDTTVDVWVEPKQN